MWAIFSLPSRPSDWPVGHFDARNSPTLNSPPAVGTDDLGCLKNPRAGGHYTQLLHFFSRSCFVFSTVTKTCLVSVFSSDLREGC